MRAPSQETQQPTCHNIADVRNCHKAVVRGLRECINVAKRSSQVERRFSADVTDAKGENELVEVDCTTLRNLIDELLCRHVTEAIEILHVIDGQAKHVGRSLQQAFANEAFNDFLAKPVDAERTAGVQNTFTLFGKALLVRTAQCDFILTTFDSRATHWTIYRQRNIGFFAVTQFREHLRNLRNNIARLRENHRVANLQSQSRNFVSVMQRCVRHGCSRNKRRRDGGDRS